MITENYIITFGKYKNKKLKDIPARYLLNMYNNNYGTGELVFFISKNLKELKKRMYEELKQRCNPIMKKYFNIDDYIGYLMNKYSKNY